MKKLLTVLTLSATILLTACGDSTPKVAPCDSSDVKANVKTLLERSKLTAPLHGTIKDVKFVDITTARSDETTRTSMCMAIVDIPANGGTHQFEVWYDNTYPNDGLRTELTRGRYIGGVKDKY